MGKKILLLVLCLIFILFIGCNTTKINNDPQAYKKQQGNLSNLQVYGQDIGTVNFIEQNVLPKENLDYYYKGSDQGVSVLYKENSYDTLVVIVSYPYSSNAFKMIKKQNEGFSKLKYGKYMLYSAQKNQLQWLSLDKYIISIITSAPENQEIMSPQKMLVDAYLKLYPSDI